MTTPNYQGLTDEQLLQAAKLKGVDVSDILQKPQQKLSREQLEQMTDAELIQLAQSQRQPQEQQESSLLQQILPNIFGAVGQFAPSIPARGVEGLIGLPGQMQQGIEGLFGLPEGALGGAIGGLTGLQAPSPEDIREAEKQFIGDVFEPRNEYEAIAGEVAQDTMQLMASLPGAQGLSAYRALGSALGGNLAKQGLINGFDIDEGTADLAKLPVYLLTAGGFGPNKKGFIDQTWKNFDNLVEGVKVETGRPFVQRLRNFVNQMRKGGTTSQEKMVIEKVEELLGRLGDGVFDLEELSEANKVINASLRNTKEFDKEGRFLLKTYQQLVGEGVQQFGSPEIMRSWKEANLATSALGAHNSLQQAFKNVFKKSEISPQTQAILTYLFPKGTGAVMAGKLMQDRVNLLNRIMNNPVARDFYIQATQAALQGKAGIAAKNAKQLDEWIKRAQGIGVEMI